MKRVVVDASALAAIVFQESKRAAIEDYLEGAVVFAPRLLEFELSNAARNKMAQSPKDALDILRALARGLEERWGLNWCDVQPIDVVLVSQQTGLSVYDASYLWLAGSLGAELVTLDERLAAASERLSG